MSLDHVGQMLAVLGQGTTKPVYLTDFGIPIMASLALPEHLMLAPEGSYDVHGLHKYQRNDFFKVVYGNDGQAQFGFLFVTPTLHQCLTEMLAHEKIAEAAGDGLLDNHTWQFAVEKYPESAAMAAEYKCPLSQYVLEATIQSGE
jgi:hypothetical protein